MDSESNRFRIRKTRIIHCKRNGTCRIWDNQRLFESTCAETAVPGATCAAASTTRTFGLWAATDTQTRTRFQRSLKLTLQRSYELSPWRLGLLFFCCVNCCGSAFLGNRHTGLHPTQSSGFAVVLGGFQRVSRFSVVLETTGVPVCRQRLLACGWYR